MVKPESLELFKAKHLFQLELKEFKTIYELLNIALDLNGVLNVFDSNIFSEDFEELLHKIDQYKKADNKNAEIVEEV